MPGTLQPLIERLIEASSARGSALEGKSTTPDFFSKEATLDGIFKLFDRTEYVAKLKKLETKSHLIKERMAAKSPVEFMAGLERDVRARYGSRLDNYRSAALSKRMPALFFERYRGSIETLEA